MSTFGIRIPCPECGRDVGVLPAGSEDRVKLRRHSDDRRVDRAWCKGSLTTVTTIRAEKAP